MAITAYTTTNEVTGTGYTAGGATLTTVAPTTARGPITPAIARGPITPATPRA